MSKNTKTKIVLAEEPKTKISLSEEPKETEFEDFLFRFGKYKNMLCSNIITIETVNPKTKEKQKTGVNYIQWVLKNVLFLTADDKMIIQQILDNYTKK